MIDASPFRIVVIGPECTGKTTLARELAAELGTSASREWARDYVERVARGLTAADVEPIARGQAEAEDAAVDEARRAGAASVLLDTDLVSTCVYARHYYGDCPPWIEAEARSRLGGLYLLLHPDVPWVAEGFQREQPGRRAELLGLFRDTLAAWGARVVEVRGGWDERRATAIAAVARVRCGPPS